jgi:hypothetical protein
LGKRRGSYRRSSIEHVYGRRIDTDRS